MAKNSAVVYRKRDAGSAPMRRFARMDSAEFSDDGILRIVASTDAPVRFGSWREVLVHTDGAIDRKGLHSVLLNHDPNQIIGTIRKVEISDGQMRMEVAILPDVRLSTGATIRDAVKAGALRGVSIGYDYSREDYADDEQTRTRTVRRWRALEASLTPIPADAEAGVRSLPFPDNTNKDLHREEKPMKNQITLVRFLALVAAFPHLRDSLAERAQIVDADSDETKAGEIALRSWAESHQRTGDESSRAREMADLRERAERAERENRIRSAAQQHGVAVDDVDFGKFRTVEEGLAELLKRKAGTESQRGGTPAGTGVLVTADAGDKFLARVRSATLYAARLQPETEAEKRDIAAVGGVRAMNWKAMFRQLARLDGFADADDWSDFELANFVSGRVNLATFGHRRDAANKITSNFSSILANVAHKAMLAGLNAYNAATWNLWTTQRNVPNFLQVTNAGLASGRLTQTAEGEAFPELNQKDGGYNSTLGLWGSTVSLTYQAIVNDQIGYFMEELRRLGAIAMQTIDREVYRRLLNATWTNDLSTGSALTTKSNLNKPRAALKAKLSPAGEKMGVVARYLLHDPANAQDAQEATGAIYGNGQVAAPSLGARQIVPIESHWIGDTALLGGAATTDYYLTGDPSVVDTVLVNFLDGVGLSPVLVPFDAGAVAAEKYKMMLPFAATVATHTDSASNARNSGMQKATA